MTLTPVLPTTATTRFSVLLSKADVDALANDIASDGTLVHHDALVQLADAAEHAGRFPGSVAVLRDADAPEHLRGRAFLALARHWDDIVAAQPTSFDQAFGALAAQWSTHQQLRAGGDIGLLADSAERLEELRAHVRSAVPAQ